MPLYEYECLTCRRHTEKIQKFSDPEITLCPHCGGPLERVLSAPAIAFKGGGWFKDGYGNAKPAASSGEASGDKPSGDGTSADKPSSDTKPASASEGSSSGDSSAKPAASTETKSTPTPAAPSPSKP